MKPTDAAQIIRELAKYLRENPYQVYQVTATMTGVRVEASAPNSIGFQATAIGGSGGGTVTGAVIQPKFGDVAIKFTQAQGEEAAAENVRRAADLMDELAHEAEQPQPDTGKDSAHASSPERTRYPRRHRGVRRTSG